MNTATFRAASPPEGRLALLANAIRAFAEAAIDPEGLLEVIARQTGELLGAFCSFAMEEPDSEVVRYVAAYDPDPATKERMLAVFGSPIRRADHPFASHFAAGASHVLYPALPAEVLRARAPSVSEAELEALGVRSTLLVLMRSRSETVGWLSLIRHGADAQPFDQADVELAQSLADHAASNLLNARLLAQRERDAARRTALSEAARSFAAGTEDEAQLASLVARRIAEIFDGLCVLRRESSANDNLVAEGVYHSDPRISEMARELARLPMKRGQGVTGSVVANGKAVIVDDPSPATTAMQAGPYAAFVTEIGISSTMFAPLTTHDRTVGVVAVGASGGRRFSADDLALLEDLAAHASVALMNSHLLAESRRTEEVLRRGFLDAAPDAVLIVGMDGKIVMANRRVETLFGFAPSELVGQPVESVVPQRLREVLPVAQPTDAGLGLVARRKDGGEFAAEITLSPIDSAGGVLVAAAVRDVTERRREMDERNQRMAEANRLKSEFLANMSHELRTPLNAIIGFASLMHAGKTGELAPAHTEYLGDILSSAKHLLQLINDILDLAKIESGRMELRYQRVDLGVIVAEVRDILRGLTVGKRVHLSTDIDPELGSVEVDPRMLKQVLYNYLSNAIKFSSDQATIRVHIARLGSDELRIDVEDNGIGIAASDLHRLFIEFQQLEAVATKRHQGTGLGLALVKRIVEAHGGRVGVESTLGKGSTFTAIFPRARRGGPGRE